MMWRTAILVGIFCSQCDGAIVVPYCVTNDDVNPPNDDNKATWSVYYTKPEWIEEKDAHREGHLAVGPNGEKTFWLWVRIPENTVLIDTGDFGAVTRGAINLDSIDPIDSVTCWGAKKWVDVPVVRSGPRSHALLEGGFRRVMDGGVADVPGSNRRRWVKLARINVTFKPIGQRGTLYLEFKTWPMLRGKNGRLFAVGHRHSGEPYNLAIGGHTTLGRNSVERFTELKPDLAWKNGGANDPDIQVAEGTTIGGPEL